MATQSFSGANDAFNAVKVKCLKAAPEQIDEQVRHADITWQFLFGFVQKKAIYRAVVAQLIRKFAAVPSWVAVYREQTQLHAIVPKLHKDVQAALAPMNEGLLAVSLVAPPEPPQTLHTNEAGDEVDNEGGDMPTNFAQKMPTTPAEQVVLEQIEHVPFPTLVKKCSSFLKRAKDLDLTQPIVAYYCRVHLVEILINARQRGESTPDSDAILFETLDCAEASKKTLDLADGREEMEAYSLYLFDEADAVDRAGRGDTTTAMMFHDSGLFIEALAQFYDGHLPPDLLAKSRHAKSRAVQLHTRLKTLTAEAAQATPGPTAGPCCAMAPGVAPTSAPAPALAPAFASAPSPAPAPSPQLHVPPATLFDRQPAAETGVYHPPPPCNPSVAVIVGSSTTAREEVPVKDILIARKKADQAATQIEHDDFGGAAELIREALAYLGPGR